MTESLDTTIAVVAGLVYFPEHYVTPRSGLLRSWSRHLAGSAGIRTPEYMKALFTKTFPGGALTEVATGKVPDDFGTQARHIVLLYPDAIGMNFGWIERTLVRRLPSKSILVLNGRRRHFRLDRDMRRKLTVRRFLERFRIPEFAFLVLFVAVTPILILFDLLRGRR